MPRDAVRSAIPCNVPRVTCINAAEFSTVEKLQSCSEISTVA